MDKRKKQLKREIEQSVNKIQEGLDRLYDLNLAPYHGYYEEVLKIKERIASD